MSEPQKNNSDRPRRVKSFRKFRNILKPMNVIRKWVPAGIAVFGLE